jgi:hypothetical protein
MFDICYFHEIYSVFLVELQETELCAINNQNKFQYILILADFALYSRQEHTDLCSTLYLLCKIKPPSRIWFNL